MIGSNQTAYKRQTKLAAMGGVIVLEDKAVQLENNGSTVTLIGLSDPNFAIRNDVFDETPAMLAVQPHQPDLRRTLDVIASFRNLD